MAYHFKDFSARETLPVRSERGTGFFAQHPVFRFEKFREGTRPRGSAARRPGNPPKKGAWFSPYPMRLSQKSS